MKRTCKRILSIAIAALLALSFTACADSGKTLKIGATPAPHAEILEVVKPILAEKGIEMEITIFTDYVLPNNALDSSEIDANFFQHKPYLDDFNVNNGTKLVSAAAVHFEPLGIYAGKSSDLSAIAEGAQIAVPNDLTNEARALNLLAAQGLITLAEGAGLAATVKDIAENPYNIEIVELAAEQLTHSLQDVDFAVINGNYAVDADILDNLLVTESKDSEAATTYANIIAVREGDEDREEIKALIEALHSETVRTFIEETYGIAVVPVF